MENELRKKELLRRVNVKGFNKYLWNLSGKALHKYNMIESGDKIAVGISGGKDSMVLLNLLTRIKNIVDFEFEIYPIMVENKKEINKEMDEIKNYIEELGYEFQIEYTNIEKVVFDDRNEKNPCALCSKLRRGVLYRIMKEKKYNKLALGHHLDDCIETYFMNLFYQGNTNKMRAKYRTEKYDLEVIRPLVFVEEKTIIKYAKKAKLPIMRSSCRLDKVKIDSKRKETKEQIKVMSEKNKNLKSNLKNVLFFEE